MSEGSAPDASDPDRDGPVYRDKLGNVLSEEDVRLGRASVMFQRRYSLIALLIMIAASVVTLILVAPGTMLDYTGRLGMNGITLWLALLVPLVAQLGLYRMSFRKGLELMIRRDRLIGRTLSAILISVMLVAELYIATSGLVVGGVI